MWTQYTGQYNFNNACCNYGLLTACRLDAKDFLFGSAETVAFTEVPASEDLDTESPKEAQPSDPAPTSSELEPELESTTHELDLDFAALAEEAADGSTLQSLHSYVAGLTPAETNEYTGLFAGKNLILITAESFSKEVVDPKLTPTLYRMMTKGIAVEDYYQPAWGGSTSTGEYAILTGLIPTDGVASMSDTIGNNLYLTLGNQLQRLGYFSAAYHNGTYDYYDRNLTHENFGYSSFMGLGNGMEAGVQSLWPESDLEMIDFTVDQYIDRQPFSIYYMTVSGHATYSLGSNAMSEKNYAAVADLDCSETIKCYLACNLELEYAMTSLVAQLEEAGIADDTVIVLSTDHYPYGLEASETWGNSRSYLPELYGFDGTGNPERDHSALLIWSGCLEDQAPITVKTPTYSLDIVPTLSNLFGLEYDSRLLAGRDILSDDQLPLVIWPDFSWKTDKGYYSSSSGTFTPSGTEEVDEAYIETINSIVSNRYTFSSAVMEQDYYDVLFGEDTDT